MTVTPSAGAVPLSPGPLADGPEATQTGPATASDDTVLVEEDLLVEDVSIDGMCGVY